MASTDVTPFTTPKLAHRRRWAGALLGPASIVGLALTLWATVMSRGWAADDAMMAGIDRGPAVAVADVGQLGADLEARK